VLVDIRKSNAEKFAQLQKSGIRLDPASVVMTRLNTLLEFLLSEDDRTLYEIEFEEAVKEILDKADEQVRKAQLLAPLQQPAASGTTGLILPPELRNSQ